MAFGAAVREDVGMWLGAQVFLSIYEYLGTQGQILAGVLLLAPPGSVSKANPVTRGQRSGPQHDRGHR